MFTVEHIKEIVDSRDFSAFEFLWKSISRTEREFIFENINIPARFWYNLTETFTSNMLKNIVSCQSINNKLLSICLSVLDDSTICSIIRSMQLTKYNIEHIWKKAATNVKILLCLNQIVPEELVVKDVKNNLYHSYIRFCVLHQKFSSQFWELVWHELFDLHLLILENQELDPKFLHGVFSQLTHREQLSCVCDHFLIRKLPSHYLSYYLSHEDPLIRNIAIQEGEKC